MRAALVVACIVVGVTDAGASIKLCVRHSDEIVPVNPTFVTRLDSVNSFTATEAGSETPLAMRVTPLGDRWARIAVTAGDGKRLRVRAHGSRIRVSAGWKRSTAPVRVAARQSGSEVVLEVLHERGQLDTARVDWAFARADLVPGVQGTQIADRGWCGEKRVMATITPPKHFGIIFVRITPLLLDGSDGPIWEGWIRPDHDVLRVEQGEPPAPHPLASQCAGTSPWVTGEQPTFLYLNRERTFRASTRDGRVIPTAVIDDGSSSQVQVSAVAGDAFRLEVLPPGTDCLEVRVAKQPPPSHVRVIDAGVLDDTIVRIQLAPSSGSIYTETDVTSTVIESTGNVFDLDLTADGWLNATKVGIEQTARLWLSPVRNGFRGPACHVALVRDLTTNTVAPRADRGPAGEPSCLVANQGSSNFGAR